MKNASFGKRVGLWLLVAVMPQTAFAELHDITVDVVSKGAFVMLKILKKNRFSGK
jgi:hypothetical protein